MSTLSNYTKPSISGFIAGDPKLTFSNDGTARFYVRIGIDHFNRLEDGSFAKTEKTFHDLIQFGKGAERSADLFVKGDQFVAQGHVRDYTREVEGQERTDEQFVASRLTHDANTTTYTVTRNREHSRDSTQAEAADRVPEDRPLSPDPWATDALSR